jgi:hypothetical protein
LLEDTQVQALLVVLVLVLSPTDGLLVVEVELALAVVGT